MRLWHKDLIPALPRQQLIGQWRECCLIAKNISEKGTPNHILVNKIMDYPLSHFETYSMLVYKVMQERGWQPDKNRFFKWLPDIGKQIVTYDELFKDWHNAQYLKQCYFNLQEKYDCGGITDEEWKLIQIRVGNSDLLFKNF